MDMDGFLVIYKPKGKTSFDIVAELRLLLGIKRIGHLGTLDPLATGVLVVAIGKATKLNEFLMIMDKSYEAEVVLGASSTTCDGEGDFDYDPEYVKAIYKEKKEEIDVKKVVAALDDFVGVIDQVPPKFSAIKIGGKRAYALARKGMPVRLPSRKVKVHEITDIGLRVDDFGYGIMTTGMTEPATLPVLAFTIRCGSGTYIRSIARDLGENLGCRGFLGSLRRTQVGQFGLDQAIKLEDINLENLELISMDNVLQGWARIDLNGTDYHRIMKGQRMKVGGSFPGSYVSGYYQGKLVSILKYDNKFGNLRVYKNL